MIEFAENVKRQGRGQKPVGDEAALCYGSDFGFFN
jgi:hypothetical protein